MPANIRAIRRRIRSVRSTQQITKAMKMVAASKMRRAHDAIVAARPYSDGMTRVMSSLASRMSPAAHPLLREVQEEKRVRVVVITSDKGLAGAFNATILREAQAFLAERAARGQEVDLVVVGRKARDYFRRRPVKIHSDHVGLVQPFDYETVAGIARSIMRAFLPGEDTPAEVDGAYLIYNEFRSILSQKVVVRRLLPLERVEEKAEVASTEYIFEPPAEVILRELLPRHFETQVWRAMLESAAAEHSARMTAMDSATRNAKEMIERLTLQMNRVRQASITKELIEIVSGAQALEEG